MKWLFTSVVLLAVPSVVSAQAITKYKYDALGRLIEASTDSGPGKSTTAIQYDPVGNRKNYKISGAADGSDNGAGASVPSRPRFVVVPLNGFTLIPIG